MKRVKVEGMCHQLVKAKLKRIVAKDFQIIYIKKDTLIEIVIKVIGHKRTDMRVKRLFYNMDSVLARAGGIFLQPERPALPAKIIKKTLYPQIQVAEFKIQRDNKKS